MLQVSPIPATVASTVPVAKRTPFSQAGSGFTRLMQLVVLVTAAGSHANFVATVEGSNDGTHWFNVLHSTMSSAAFLTIDENGLTLSAAQALAGVALSFDLALPHVRLGLSGDGAGGSGFIQYRSIR